MIAPRAFELGAGTDSHVVDRGYSWSMTTALPSIFSVMIFTSPAFLSLKLSNFWITASATPMPVAYGRGREPSRASEEAIDAMRGGRAAAANKSTSGRQRRAAVCVGG